MYRPTTPVVFFTFDEFVTRQIEWSWKTFGSPAEGRGPLGPLDHLKKEIVEIEKNPEDVTEWVDAIFLSIDGFHRAGGRMYSDESTCIHPYVLPSSLDHLKMVLVLLTEEPQNAVLWFKALAIAVKGYERACGDSDELLMQMFAKQRKNFNRDWPDWRLTDPNKAVEHVKGRHD